jgi:UDP-N-acetylglucosamine 2-epimerase (non-hydrolysing)
MDSPFPEEMNRRLTSPLARWNFCPTEISKNNLIKEGIISSSCYVTGNSVIDALLYVTKKQSQSGISAKKVAECVGIPETFFDEFLSDKSKKPWILVTGHRRESFGGGFERICESINRITQTHPDVGVLYPVHLNPQVQAPVKKILGSNPRVALVAPAAYEEFVWLMNRCTFLLSDSGGVQEEAPSLGKPVLVMRDTTERPEGIEAGTCRLVGTNPDLILREANLLLNNSEEYKKRSGLKNPYGDGQAAQKIKQILEDSLSV